VLHARLKSLEPKSEKRLLYEGTSLLHSNWLGKEERTPSDLFA